MLDYFPSQQRLTPWTLSVFFFLLNGLELRFVIFEHSFEIYVGAIAVIFTSLGIWLAIKLTKPKVETVVVEKYLYADPNIPFTINFRLNGVYDFERQN